MNILKVQNWLNFLLLQCSSVCGDGIRRRTVTCHDSNDGSRLSLSYCSSKSKPKTTEKCLGRECSHWKVGEWAQVL